MIVYIFTKVYDDDYSVITIINSKLLQNTKSKVEFHTPKKKKHDIEVCSFSAYYDF